MRRTCTGLVNAPETRRVAKFSYRERTVGAALRGRPFVKSKRPIERVAASRVAQTNQEILDVRQGAATEGRPYSTFRVTRWLSVHISFESVSQQNS